MARLLVLFVTAFVDMVGLTMILPLLPFYATKLGASATWVGVLVSAFSVAQLVVAPLWGRFSDRYGRRPVILAGLLLTACAYVIFAFAGSVLVLLAAVALQVWLGVLLMFDTERGPVTRFNRPGETPATQPTTLPATQGVAVRE